MFVLIACLTLFNRLVLVLVLNIVQKLNGHENGLEMYHLFLYVLGTSNSFFCTCRNVSKCPVS